MASYSADNKRIAKNTLIIYVNMLLRLVIGLYCSRLVLEALGFSDYGLYNVVGGVVGLFTFISTSLSKTTSRFINVEMGKEKGDLNGVFNVCNILHLGIALLIFLFSEIIGVYYIEHYLNIDPGKEADAMYAFQVSIIMCCVGVTNVPFSSMFYATEKFLFRMVVQIMLMLFQLLMVLLLFHYEGNRLRLYSLMMTLSTVLTFIIYHYACYRYWPDVIKWKLVKERKLYKEALVYNNYNLLATMSVMGRSQGSALLINYFFGTTVNAAFAVAKSVEGHVLHFIGVFDSAAGPQLTHNYSAGNQERVIDLSRKIGKYCILMMMVASFPLWAEMDFVLHLWLVHVPDGPLSFCYMTLLIAFISITSGGLTQVINASGMVGRFRTVFSILMLSCIPMGFVLLKNGSPPYALLFLFAIVDAIWRVIQLYLLKKILKFPVKTYIYDVYIPALKVLVVMTCFLVTTFRDDDAFVWHAFRLVLVFLFTVLSVVFVGLNGKERAKLWSFVNKKCNGLKTL